MGFTRASRILHPRLKERPTTNKRHKGPQDCFTKRNAALYAHKLYDRVRTMESLFDKTTPTKPTNLSINSDLLTNAKALDINLPATLEKALESEVRQNARQKWLRENKKALENCNQLTQEQGLFADKHRGY